ncbi:putative quinol monooxygenase [Flavobacteriaceae bacterium LMO-SS05]
MFVRIVKMGFEPSKIEDFLAYFETHKVQIRNFEGCQFLELYRDKNHNTVFFTYSFWNTEDDLEQYRQSDLFKSVWSKTKPLFNAKPEAWTVEKVVSLE